MEINPKLRTIELTKLLENMQETLKKETEYVIIHKLLMILIYNRHNKIDVGFSYNIYFKDSKALGFFPNQYKNRFTKLVKISHRWIKHFRNQLRGSQI